MAFVYTLDVTVPPNSQDASLGAQRIRELTGAMIERLNSFFVDSNTQPLTVKTGAVFAGTAAIAGNFTVNTTMFTVDSTTGNIVAAGTATAVEYLATGNPSFLAAAGGVIAWSGRSQISSPADGKVVFTNAAATGFTLLTLGPNTNAFPALKRNGVNLEARLGDDSAGTGIIATTFTGNLVGGVTGAVTGNADTATKLQTGRTINGVTFDGSANITVPTTDLIKGDTNADTLTTQTSFITSGITPLSLTSGRWSVRAVVLSTSSAGGGVKQLNVKLVAGTPASVSSSVIMALGAGAGSGTPGTGQAIAGLGPARVTNYSTTLGYNVVEWWLNLTGSTTIDLQFANESGTETQKLLAGTNMIATKLA